jgi:hypothetical protein
LTKSKLPLHSLTWPFLKRKDYTASRVPPQSQHPMNWSKEVSSGEQTSGSREGRTPRYPLTQKSDRKREIRVPRGKQRGLFNMGESKVINMYTIYMYLFKHVSNLHRNV